MDVVSSILEAAWFTGTWIGGTTLLGKKTVYTQLHLFIHSYISFSTHVSSIHTYLYYVTFLYISATFFLYIIHSVSHSLTHTLIHSLVHSSPPSSLILFFPFLKLLSPSHFFYGSKASGEIRITFSGSQRTF